MDNNETMDTLPEGWIEVKLEDISLTINYGYTAKSTKNNTGTKFLRITDIQDNTVNWNLVPFCNIEESDKYKYLLDIGDIVFARTGATVGKSYLIRGKISNAIFASYLIRIRLAKLLNPNYLYLYFQSSNYWQQIGLKAMGVGQPNVSGSSLAKLTIPLPPLKEQHRIVLKIEELFSELDHSEEGLKKAQKQLKIYKQAILKSAFEGKLTEKWREDNHYEIIRIDDSINKQLPKGWTWNNLGNIAQISMGQSPPGETYNNIGVGMPLINGPVEFNKSPFSKTKKEKWTTQPIRTCKEGDLLICVRGSTTGRQNIAGFDASIGRGVAAIHVPEKITINYLAYFTHFSERQVYEMGTGSTFPSISKEQISNFVVPICAVQEQNQIVQELEMRFTLIENLENSIDDGFRKIRLFRLAVLRKAFEGKLIPQNKNDEPATSLLKQISPEKESYILDQKMVVKEKPKKKKPMNTHNTIKEILEKTVQPIESRELWLKSKHKDNIEEFYAELKKIEHEIDILIEGKKSLIILKR
jgi:type I restriction enzyme S subunit